MNNSLSKQAFIKSEVTVPLAMVSLSTGRVQQSNCSVLVAYNNLLLLSLLAELTFMISYLSALSLNENPSAGTVPEAIADVIAEIYNLLRCFQSLFESAEAALFFAYLTANSAFLVSLVYSTGKSPLFKESSALASDLLSSSCSDSYATLSAYSA